MAPTIESRKERETRIELIDPALRQRGWLHELGMIKREVSAGLQAIQQMADFDLYDVLADLGFHIKPRTRQERVQEFIFKHEDWLDGLPPQTAAAIRAIVGQFEQDGTAGLESKQFSALMIFQAVTPLWCCKNGQSRG